MDEIKIEQLGGFAGFGGPHLEGSGVVSMSSLSDADRVRLDEIFRRGQREDSSAPASVNPDEFRYRLTRNTQSGTQSIEVAESELPDAIKNSVTTKIK